MTHSNIKMFIAEQLRVYLRTNYKNTKVACEELGLDYRHIRKLFSCNPPNTPYERLFDIMEKIGYYPHINFIQHQEVE
ncbi:hypothetical protein [Scandinavium manionii]|uniref:hypothetical protein n=1 Tax=Scandinavium manionii TaxID=2926520 RepID=UPI002164FACA|nr:hypothetical protein [Scandinavium manionii]MCS2147682.1 hypothetical protein [Scandinavium manionii]